MSPAVKINASIKEHSADNILRRFLFFSLKKGYIKMIFMLYVKWQNKWTERIPPSAFIYRCYPFSASLWWWRWRKKNLVMVLVVVVMVVIDYRNEVRWWRRKNTWNGGGGGVGGFGEGTKKNEEKRNNWIAFRVSKNYNQYKICWHIPTKKGFSHLSLSLLLSTLTREGSEAQELSR